MHNGHLSVVLKFLKWTSEFHWRVFYCCDVDSKAGIKAPDEVGNFNWKRRGSLYSWRLHCLFALLFFPLSPQCSAWQSDDIETYYRNQTRYVVAFELDSNGTSHCTFTEERDIESTMEILRDFGRWSIVVDSNCAIAVPFIRRTTGLVAIYTHFHGCSPGHCSKDGPSRRIVSSRKAEADPHCNLSLNWNDELHWMNRCKCLKLWNAGNLEMIELIALGHLGPLGVESGAATNPVTRPFPVLIWGSRDLETLSLWGCIGSICTVQRPR